MEDYLEKRKYVHRKSYKHYSKINLGMHLGEVLFTGCSLSAIAMPLL